MPQVVSTLDSRKTRQFGRVIVRTITGILIQIVSVILVTGLYRWIVIAITPDTPPDREGEMTVLTILAIVTVAYLNLIFDFSYSRK